MKPIKRKLITVEFPPRNSRHNNNESLPARELRVADGPTMKKGKLQGGSFELGSSGKRVWTTQCPPWWSE